MRLWSHKDVCKIFGLKGRTLQSWAEKGFIKPYEGARGRGRVRRYDFGNLVEIEAMLEMATYGPSPTLIKRVLGAGFVAERVRAGDFGMRLYEQKPDPENLKRWIGHGHMAPRPAADSTSFVGIRLGVLKDRVEQRLKS